MQEQGQLLHPCLVLYGECSFGPQCLFTDAPRNACIYYLKGKCTNPQATSCSNGKHYPELAVKAKEAQALLYASTGKTPRIQKKVWRPHSSHGWKVGGMFCTRCGTALSTSEAKGLCSNPRPDYKESDEPEKTEAEKSEQTTEAGVTSARTRDNGNLRCNFFRTGQCAGDPCFYSHVTGEYVKRRRDRKDGGPRRDRDSFQTFTFGEPRRHSRDRDYERDRDSGYVTHDLAPEREWSEGEWLQSGKRIRRPSRSEEYDREDQEFSRPREAVIGGLGRPGPPRVDVLPAIQAKGKFY